MLSTTYSKDFRSILEYLLFRAGLFHLQPTNLYYHHICSNHLGYLTLMGKNRCYACKHVRKQDGVGKTEMRLVSKALAIGIWKGGQPDQNWALFDRPICGTCRRYCENKYLTDEIRSKADTIFGKQNHRSNVRVISFCRLDI